MSSLPPRANARSCAYATTGPESRRKSAAGCSSGGYQGVSFAIPIDVAMNVGDQLRTSGHVTRGKLGVTIQGVNQALAQSFGLDSPAGALVSSVEKGSPAEKAGLQPGDVILSFNGKPVRESSELPALVAAVKPGTRADLEVWRDKRSRDIKVTLGGMALS